MNSTTGGADQDRMPAYESAGGAPRESGRIELAREAPFRLGALDVEPARRRAALEDGREEILEPRVMQVLVALVRAGEINHRQGGRGVYFTDPDGHLLEVLTRGHAAD